MWTLLLTLSLATIACDARSGCSSCENNNHNGARYCTELQEQGVVISDWYTIYPFPNQPMRVYCDMHTDGGGWIVFQRRWDGSVDFHRDWKSYKQGFGSSQEFWLGNENIHTLTSTGKWELRVDLQDFDANKFHGKYSFFSTKSEKEQYQLELGPFTGGNAGDSLVHHNNMKFSTYDSDNDAHATANCGSLYKGGWWFIACHYTYLNGLYFKGFHKDSFIGINWVTAKGDHYSFEHVEMKIRPVPGANA